MSSTNKPFTANFQLETKIRVIIQQVLSATMRKLSQFNEKIDKFQDYFIVFKERIQALQKGCLQNKNGLASQLQERGKIKKELTNQIIKSEQQHQQRQVQLNEIKNEITQSHKTVKQVQRQNENLNSQLSKTKGKFLQYSNVIGALKQEVSWKITKYIQQTAQTNTAIKINNEQMKKEYFEVQLMLQKQKERYDKIIEMNEQYQQGITTLQHSIQQLNTQNQERFKENKQTLNKLDQYDTLLQSKLKSVDNKYELRVAQLEKDNRKVMQQVKKLETFNRQLEDVRADLQQNRLQLMRKLQDTNKKLKDESQMQQMRLSKELMKIQKATQKKFTQLKETAQKSEDFLTQKIDFIKMEIQNQLSSKTSQLLKQKESNNKVNSSTMEEVSARINKSNLQLHKQLVKLENDIKEVKIQTRKQVESVKQEIQGKLQNVQFSNRKNSDDGEGTKISPQLLQRLNIMEQKFPQVFTKLQTHSKQILQLHQNENKAQEFQKQMVCKIDEYFKTQQEDIGKKVQKIMFLVTKMRGDNIIRNQFTDKQIKQIKRNHGEYRDYTETILKLLPAFGQCINLIMALIYDAEYQHAKIIQDTLPLLKKDQEKFNTCIEGVLYEFKEKKKAGVICYRHKDLKKTDLVKATFTAYIKLWQDLYQNDFKESSHLMPRSFYKKAIEQAFGYKSVEKPQKNRKQTSTSPGKDSKQREFQRFQQTAGFNNRTSQFSPGHFKNHLNEKDENRLDRSISGQQMTQNASREATKSLKKIQEEEMIRQLKESTVNSGANTENIASNSSFQIRKKKTLRRDQVVVVNFPEQS